MTASTRELLLQQIWNDPLSDSPRLVYADLLEKEDELDRANLIRLQVGRANLPQWDPRVLEIELEERAILASCEAAWRRALPQINGVRWGPFARGFVGKVAFNTVELLQKHRTECLAATPVHSIVVSWPRSRTPPKLEAIEGLRELTLVGTVMRPEDVRWLATSPLLAGVRSLNLIDSEIRSGLPHLFKSPHVAQLEALRMPLHLIGNGGIKKLTAAALPKLTVLDLSVGTDEELGSGGRAPSAKLDSRSALELAAWGGLAQIQSLDFSGSKLGREGLSTLLMTPYTKALKTLCIRDIADAEWEMDDSLAAFQAGPAGTLDELDVSDNDIDADAAHAMAESRALQELKVLRIDNVRSKNFERLAQARWIHSLRVLSCGESALQPILQRGPKHLHTIRIVAEGHAVRDLVKRLSVVPLPAVTTLDLGASHITDEGLRRLGQIETLPNLTAVTLRGERAVFTPTAAAEFARSPVGKRLKSLDTGIAELDRLAPAPSVDIGGGEYSGPFRFL